MEIGDTAVGTDRGAVQDVPDVVRLESIPVPSILSTADEDPIQILVFHSAHLLIPDSFFFLFLFLLLFLFVLAILTLLAIFTLAISSFLSLFW